MSAPSNILPITNVINVSVANPPTGLANYNINNLLYVTKETPVNGALGDYTIYLTPTQVGTDWGLSSETYLAAVNVFSQQPNILSAGGAFIVAAMAGGDTLVTMYNKISQEIFFGAMLFGGYQPNDAEMQAAAAVFQSAQIMLFLSSNDTAELTTGHAFFAIQAAGQSYTRCLLYTVSLGAARLFAAAYAGLALSTNFNGSATTQTLWLKNLANITPDPGITQTILNTCQTVGVDVYVNLAGLSKLISTGGNTFFDQVFGTLWLVYSLQVAGFNALAQTPTKIPQTEPGMAYLRNAYIAILEQGVINGFLAPGAWNSPVLFGDPTSLRNAILNIGYFVYSIPVNQQSQANRVARQAPLVQIAAKLAGAIQTSNVVVFINP